MQLDIFGGKVFHSIEKCLLHYERILIAKTNPNPFSLELATWEYQFVLVRLRNGFIAACDVFVCINVVWSDKYLGLVLLSEVFSGKQNFLKWQCQKCHMYWDQNSGSQQRHAEKRENWPEHLRYLPWLFCLLCHPGADPFPVMESLEAATSGMELEGSPVPQDLHWGRFPSRGCTIWMCLLLPLLQWSAGDQELGKSQKVFPAQQPELGWVFKAGGRWEQKTWKSEFSVSDIYGYWVISMPGT